jgi:hypothetical protein
MTAAGPALVEEKRMVKIGIEELTMHMLSTATRPAMQKKHWDTFAPAYLLDIDPVPIPHVEHAGVEGAQMFVNLRSIGHRSGTSGGKTDGHHTQPAAEIHGRGHPEQTSRATHGPKQSLTNLCKDRRDR